MKIILFIVNSLLIDADGWVSSTVATSINDKIISVAGGFSYA